MTNEKENVGKQAKKESLSLTVEFTRRSFYDDKTKREIPYVECTAEYCDESFRFKIADKDSRLFQYLMKANGFPIVSHDGEE